MSKDTPRKVLVVDDEESSVTLLSNVLTRANYEVVSATNGREAVELAKSTKPDLIILDILLPDIMGGEVSRILSEDAATSSIPIIFLTGLNTKEDENTIKETGNYYLLSKPITREDLIEAVDKVLSGAQAL